MPRHQSSGVEASEADFELPASAEVIGRASAAVALRGIDVEVVEDGSLARAAVLKRIPAGARVLTARSRTLEAAGLLEALDASDAYRSIRGELAALPAEARRDRTELRATPDWIVGSVHAVTEEGEVLVASESGSQIAAYAYGAGQVIWVVGAQKIVPTLADGLRRLQEYALPLEAARVPLEARVKKTLIVAGEAEAGRVAMVIVRQRLGF